MNRNSILKSAITLLCITAIAGAALSLVYELTKDPIAQAETAAKAEAYRNVYPDAVAFADLEDAEAQTKKIKAALDAEGYARVTVEDVLLVNGADGAAAGYVMTVTSPNGYGGDVKVALGISTDGVIQGFEPLSHGETPGYGANMEDQSYRDSFKGKTNAADVDQISGATYTTTALREATGAALLAVSCLNG